MPSGQMRSVDSARFAMVPRPDVPRSSFDVSHYHKTTLVADYLIPVYVDEVLPGDSMSVRMSAFMRTATAIVPVMDNLTMESHWFFVPNRLVWANWERFMGEQANPADTTQFLMPYVPLANTDILTQGIYDYFGITMNGVGTFNIVSLPFRAYNLIWNDWYRDQDLQNPLTVSTGDGPDAPGDFLLMPRGKKHDYFTSARPWPAKPTAMTSWDGFNTVSEGGNYIFSTFNRAQAAAPLSGVGKLAAQVSTAGPISVIEGGFRNPSFTNYYNGTDLRVRAEGVNGYPDMRVLVSDIRTATLIQQMMERDARGGTRYAEIVRAHFGVISPDARLQRPEFLGAGRSFVNVHPVAQTSASDLTGSTTVLGEQAGVGTIQAYKHGFSHSFTEHGFVIGLVSIRGDLTYQQGVNRMWQRRSKFQFYWPGMNGLSEQAIQQMELYASGTSADQTVFGYQERWSDYKYKPSRTSGAMRSTYSAPLDMWHFGQKFTVAPTLSSGFVLSDTPVERVMQVPGAGIQFYADMLFDARLTRAMPVYSLPGMGARL